MDEDLGMREVTTVYLLDGGDLNVHGDKMEPRTVLRKVRQRADGSHFIITLGHREDVFLQEDGTFIEYLIGHTIQPISLADVIKGIAL